MTEFQAAFGSSQMKKLDRIIAARRRLAYHYDSLLENDPVLLPVVPSQSFHVYQSYVVLLPEEATQSRSEIICKLKDMGIETNIGTWHMPLTSYFCTRYGYRVGDYPFSDSVFSRALTLSLYETLKYEDQKKVVNCLRKMVR
jgi:dTDP-4-amino-4,6-dideoxygalactose transaminase